MSQTIRWEGRVEQLGKKKEELLGSIKHWEFLEKLLNSWPLAYNSGLYR
jgi:hypothetical protein